MRKSTNFIVVHCAATSPSMDIGAKEIDRWHRQRGWLGIGYHFVIRRNGTVEEGRHIDKAGAHAVNYNNKSVGVCLVGGVKEDKKTPEANFTNEQYKALVALLKRLKEKYPSAKIIGHNEIAAKACPSFNVQNWLKTVNLN